ncbi:hypothetical protein AAU61_01930 [Desulfocarbo indianensis]|nr:hypothetical protein AAU61_01930 [Desulfocarbo indianensis]
MKKLSVRRPARPGGAFGKIAMAAALAVFLAALWGAAQPAASAWAAAKSPMEEPQAYQIKLEKDPKGKGKAAFVKGIAQVQPSTLKVSNLWITQPLKLVVVSEDKAKDVRVELRRYHWESPMQTCSTGAQGDCRFSLRMQGDLYISLVSPQGPAPVFIGVQVGEEDQPQMKPVLVPKGGKP